VPRNDVGDKGFSLEVMRKLRRVMNEFSRASDRLLNELGTTVIGQELGMRYSVPGELSDALFSLVNQLDAHNTIDT
jgi:hypothetical protein